MVEKMAFALLQTYVSCRRKATLLRNNSPHLSHEYDCCCWWSSPAEGTSNDKEDGWNSPASAAVVVLARRNSGSDVKERGEPVVLLPAKFTFMSAFVFKLNSHLQRRKGGDTR